MMYEQQKTPFTSQSSHFSAKTLSKEDGVQIGPSDARALYLAHAVTALKSYPAW
jgi:hypothetical protein